MRRKQRVCTQFIPLAHVLLAHAAIAASGDSGIIPPAFAVAPSRFRIFRARALYGALPGGCGGVNKLRSAQLARGHSRKVHQTSCQRLIGAAKEVWSVTGGNTPLQTLMGTGAGVATEDVCTLRHDGTGTGIELWHGSFGWFDFMTHDGAPIILSDTWGIQIERPTQVLPSGGQQYSALRLAAEKGETDGFRPTDEPIKAGTWTIAVQGEYLVVKNQYASRQSLVLTEEGFVFIGSRGTSLSVSQGQQPQELPLPEALKLVPGVVLK